MTDLLLVGGGLANGLLAERLVATRPRVDFLVLEGGSMLGGNHTWSFHGSDVDRGALERLIALGAYRFDGHDVRFPGLERTLKGSYYSLRSEDFARNLGVILGPRVRLHSRVADVGATHVVLDTGARLDAGAVLDARALVSAWPCGWQKFLGQEIELAEPHDLERPLLMDATVEQHDGFRFVYVVPFSPTRVLVEDTVYSDGPALDLDEWRARIARWLARRRWRVASIEREEHAALPIPFGGEAPQHDRPVLGVSAGFFHATTGYSLPFAVRMAERIAAQPTLDAPALTTFLNAEAAAHWRSQRFFRLLNRMLFLAAAPEQRVGVFSSFYRHEEALIERFYAGGLRPGDMLNVIARGSTTVPALKAIRAALALSGGTARARGV
jgi:lycopene beta-cyclase